MSGGKGASGDVWRAVWAGMVCGKGMIKKSKRDEKMDNTLEALDVESLQS